MYGRIRQGLSFFLGASLIFACAKIADLESPTSPEELDVVSKDASNAVDGVIRTAEGLSISPSALSLGPATCRQSRSGAITIKNNGKKALSFELTLIESDTFTLRGATGGVVAKTVDVGDFVVVNVDAVGVAPGSASADIVVRTGGTVQSIHVTLDVQGGLLAINPPVVDFGEVRKDTTSSPIPIEFKNDGNEQISVTGFANLTGDFYLSPATFAVAPGSSTIVNAVMTAGAPSPTTEIKVTPALSGALCTPPVDVTLRGSRVSQDVMVDVATLDFGDFNCKDTPSKQETITVANYSLSSTASFTATLPPSSRFRFVGASSGTVPRATNDTTPGKTTFTIAANTVDVPLGEFDETLEVKITDPPQASGSKFVALHIGAYGAILEVTPAELDGFAQNQTKAFTVRNVGNARTCVRYTDITGNGFYILDDDEAFGPGGIGDLRVQFAASSKGTYDYAIPITRINCSGVSAPLCTPPPTPKVHAIKP